MAAFDLEKYLEGLTPEQQAKARACKSVDELLRLADAEDIALPADALEAVAGGCGLSDALFGNAHQIADTYTMGQTAVCPYCGGVLKKDIGLWTCQSCKRDLTSAELQKK